MFLFLLARQLVEFKYGDGVDVALGGGRKNFYPKEEKGPDNLKGVRSDERNLTNEWLLKSKDHIYVWNKEAFENINHKSGQK